MKILGKLRTSASVINPFGFILAITLIIGLVTSRVSAYALADDTVTFSNAAAFYQYGLQATFQAQVKSSNSIKELIILIQSDGQQPISQSLPVSDNGSLIYQLDLSKANLRPFGLVEYWFKGQLSNGKTFESDHYSFDYIDNRFEWYSTSDGRFDVHWNTSDLALGDTVLQVALDSLRSAVSYLPVSPTLPIRIFIYSSGKDLQDALQLGKVDWVAGHASPDLNLILLSLPPSVEQRLELERQLPHELIHILEYQVTGDRYPATPTWLNEGLASLAELYPNPDYPRALEQAAKTSSLLPIESFCSAFPTEASQAILAYAESASFVKFLSDQFGVPSLQALLQKYGDGMDCGSAVQSVYGVNIAQLETRWKQEELGINPAAAAAKNLAPYLTLSLLIILPPAAVILVRRARHSKNPEG